MDGGSVSTSGSSAVFIGAGTLVEGGPEPTKAAMAAGGRDNGAPGIREHYHPNYYGAFVLDPDGNNIEAVCHKPE